MLTKTLEYLYNDNLGSTIAIANSSNVVQKTITYTEWGMPSDTKDARFTGKQMDSSGLYYFNARYYDPTIARFITEDPSKQGNSWYNYCANDPINMIDPDGKQTVSGINAFDPVSAITSLAMPTIYDMSDYAADQADEFVDNVSYNIRNPQPVVIDKDMARLFPGYTATMILMMGLLSKAKAIPKVATKAKEKKPTYLRDTKLHAMNNGYIIGYGQMGGEETYGPLKENWWRPIFELETTWSELEALKDPIRFSRINMGKEEHIIIENGRHRVIAALGVYGKNVTVEELVAKGIMVDIGNVNTVGGYCFGFYYQFDGLSMTKPAGTVRVAYELEILKQFAIGLEKIKLSAVGIPLGKALEYRNNLGNYLHNELIN